MYTCNHCKNKFKNIPYVAYPNKKKYCSLNCMPDSAIDRPYSFQYANLIDCLRDIEIRIDNIVSLDDRIELENEVTDISSSYTLEAYGDDEGLFYKQQIIKLLPTIDELYDKIHNIFRERKLRLRLATVITWDSVIQLFGKDLSEMIFSYFESRMSGIAYQNLYDTLSEYSIDLGYFKDKLYVNTLAEAENIKNIYMESLNYFKSLFTEQQLNELDCYDNFVAIKNLAYCVVCHEWENEADFSFDEELGLYKCNQWYNCYDYENYY
ncbi:hypothetical protein [Clostridium folliculivorans]|uniref:hypothetical protein n=1 Tax=Clostridium folliculivorans TaxID=2886038 RepID=UPI0021C2D1AB|nr:hypothetical protein [Clostridium folliculivorans]GKU29300.1 hypothetical protein CFB3_14060 [Clostridium folliculivorans]